MIDLTEDTFLVYVAKVYNSPTCIISELEDDLKRIKYLKRLFRRYKSSNILKERLILNHIILLNNVFGAEATPRILFYKIGEEDYITLKTFLLYLNILPKVVFSINGKNIITDDIPIDLHIAKVLREI
jgi:hypothetical protein